VWHYASQVCAQSSQPGERTLALICGGSPLDREERCLTGKLSDFGKFTVTSRD